jgi:hypothetical protein
MARRVQEGSNYLRPLARSRAQALADPSDDLHRRIRRRMGAHYRPSATLRTLLLPQSEIYRAPSGPTAIVVGSLS